MKITGFQKITLQDYPDHISSMLFTQGCNMRCPFCQNSSLINMEGNSYIDENEILEFLNSRKKMVNGLIISGGEPTVQFDLKDFIKKVKENIKIDIKLDTNGINYKVLKELIDEKLIDYVAMDIKNTFLKYDETSGVKNISIENIKKSIEYLKERYVDYEFRTTVISDYHNLQDILEIINYIGADSKYYLQNFKMSEDVIDKNLKEIPSNKLELWNKVLKKYKNVYIRGMDKEE